MNGKKEVEGVKPPAVDPIQTTIQVGARDPGIENFKGVIDEVALYNRALTEKELKLDMEKGILSAAVEPRRKLAITWAEIKSR